MVLQRQLLHDAIATWRLPTFDPSYTLSSGVVPPVNCERA